MSAWMNGLVGGVLVGLGASLLLVAHGRIAGVSNMIGALLPPNTDASAFRVWFLAGLLLSGLVASLIAPASIAASPLSAAWLAAGGLLVGSGARLSNGCTSGHGVCGVSRLAPRSLVATSVFIVFGMATVAVLRALGVVS